MKTLIIIAVLIPLVLPFLNLIYIAIILGRFYSNKKHIKILNDYCDKNMGQEFQWKKLKPKAVADNLKDLKFTDPQKRDFFKNYKKMYHYIWWYFITTLATPIIWIFALILNIRFYKEIPLEFTSVILLYGFGSTWVLGVGPLLKGLQLWGELTEKIDCFVHNIIGPNGKLAEAMPRIAARLVLFIVNFIVFILYIPAGLCFLRPRLIPDFLSAIILLILYQYLLCPFIGFITYKVLKKWRTKKQRSIQSFEYYYAIIKNNTYLVFLVVYIGVKFLQISGWEKYGISMVEAIGIIFLFDTYLQQSNNIENKR